MNLQPGPGAIVDEAQLLELVHEEADPRPGGAHHLSQRFLTNLRNYSLGYAFLTKMSKQEQNPSQSLFAGIEKLVDQVILIPNVSFEQVFDK